MIKALTIRDYPALGTSFLMPPPKPRVLNPTPRCAISLRSIALRWARRYPKFLFYKNEPKKNGSCPSRCAISLTPFTRWHEMGPKVSEGAFLQKPPGKMKGSQHPVVPFRYAQWHEMGPKVSEGAFLQKSPPKLRVPVPPIVPSRLRLNGTKMGPKGFEPLTARL